METSPSSRDDATSNDRSLLAWLVRLDLALVRFEAAWHAGEGPRIEAYLEGAEEPERSLLLRELMELEIELAAPTRRWSNALSATVADEVATLELVTQTIGGVVLDDGTAIEGDQTIDGGPSVLYDAVCVLGSEEDANRLIESPAAQTFLVDAYAHAKFIGVSPVRPAARTSRIRPRRHPVLANLATSPRSCRRVGGSAAGNAEGTRPSAQLSSSGPRRSCPGGPWA